MTDERPAMQIAGERREPPKPTTMEEMKALPYECGDTRSRASRCYSHPSRGPHNALWYYFEDITFWRTVGIRLILLLATKMPRFSMKNAVMRWTGMKIGEFVSFGNGIRIDLLFPELIEIGDDVITGSNVAFFAHQYLQNRFEAGRIKIGNRVTIGADSLIGPGVVIGDGATVFPNSVVLSDVPAGETAIGMPARVI